MTRQSRPTRAYLPVSLDNETAAIVRLLAEEQHRPVANFLGVLVTEAVASRRDNRPTMSA